MAKKRGKFLPYLSKKRPKANLKCFEYRISISVKRLEKRLSGKANFDPSSRLNCSNFKSKQCARP